MPLTQDDCLLVTGATGLVGSHVAEFARECSLRTRALVRPGSDVSRLRDWGVETVVGDLADPVSLRAAVAPANLVVHCAAKVGDWGPLEDYRRVNVQGLRNLLESVRAAGNVRRFVHISSLGVYEARDHYGTDETEPPSPDGIDGYTTSKAEAETVVAAAIEEHNLPAVILRPGFIYGPRDRTVLPRLLDAIRTKRFAYLGSGEQLMNNTYVGNVVQAVFLALENEQSAGQVYNVTDDPIVSKREFISTIAELAGYAPPTKTVPLGVARPLARTLDWTWRLLRIGRPPILSRAQVKFLGLNLDFSIARARRELGYRPDYDFQEAILGTMEWFQ
ncbi:MAG: NAD-dependent epimerase/dehydratase family protein, partial [Planctomycetaceae bacterium]